MKKRFKLSLKSEIRYSANSLIGLAKAMSKTNAKIVGWNEHEDPHIIFEVNENYPVFKPQLESYTIVVEELKKGEEDG